MRFFGAKELAGGWYFDYLHVSGILNDATDGISRWEYCDIPNKLIALYPSILWQEQDLGAEGQELCTSALAATSTSRRCRNV